MVKIEQEKVIIEFETDFPDDFIYELKLAIIFAVQNQQLEKYTNLLEVQDCNYRLLEFLKKLDE